MKPIRTNPAESSEMPPSDALLHLARVFLPGIELPRLVMAPPLGPRSGTLEAQLRKAESRYQTLVEKIPAITFMVSFENRQSEIYVSPHIERVLGYTAKEWVENPILWYQRLHTSDRDRWNREFARIITLGEPFKGDYRFLAKDGREVWIHGEVTLVRDESGRPSFLQGLGYDVTESKQAAEGMLRSHEELESLVKTRAAEMVEINRSLAAEIEKRKKAEEELRESLKVLYQAQKLEALGTLAGGIAHEFNNVLGIIIANLSVARMDLDDRIPAVAERLREAGKACERAKDIVRQIVTFSRPQEAKRELISLEKVVSEALKLLRPTIPSTVEIEVALETCPAIFGDATQVHQVLLNLCTNAWHAINGRPGQITVSLQALTLDDTAPQLHPALRAGAYVRLGVTDNGSGMDAATQARVFEPFFSTKGPGQGTGLGLAVVHGIMRAHHGAVILRSQVGEGTTFQLYFPAQEGAAKSGSSPRATAVPVGTGQHILVVEDETPLLRVASTSLKRQGYRVTAFDLPEDALRAFQADPGSCDLVLTDLTMPRMNGLDLARELLALRPELPIILTTGFVEAKTSERARAIGIKELLTKPYLPDDLARVVARLLRV